MNVIKTDLDGVLILEPKVFGDQRGFFTETYNKRTLEEHGIHIDFIQDNHSLSSTPGTIRGLHYQVAPAAQTKLVRCTSGAIYDVAVDIRRNSDTFGQWVGVILTADNHRQLLIPKGFAHGFCTLVPNTEVMYKVDEYYNPECDRGILWNEPDIGIPWPSSQPVLSAKDEEHPRLLDAQVFE
ncbi:dTDP-4-dehydrorhamnose 3,5-epimerase [Alicyclobacillus tolerans]|uniref:dTDP-4-dehydrorhamnose 3,5-epimerase n=1 Tax=Alicyclobacillus tolerans TaxID=90970 RepID=UPI001F000A80|nr:dTDP-4-dehydrorhamnose 3,5-epimerase [Alicyclobacillus tolerans]MCF8565019.1 dTDP-4-dehydrorhamnose 3,5-epimerase [Alicyclobacillus tolerans]